MKYFNWEVIKADFIKYMPWSPAIAFYVFVVVNDYLSSLLSNGNPDLHEANIFARDTSLHFVLWKGIIVDSVFFIGIGLFAWAIYHCIKHWSIPVAKMASAGFILYNVADRIQVVVQNYLYVLHLYVKDPDPIRDLFSRLFHL
jgi:hypothetical protein